ncbi:MAG: hypothetical protein NTW28_28880 [Candidatus Solibacter sp.]|nr:hypothetical protein [Candidatus Solibacter sp.]
MPDDSTAGDPATSSEAVPEPASQEQRTTSWVLPVITAVVLASAFCLYYFVYVKAQREYLGNRNFRSLAALGEQLQAQITIHGSILEFYADLARREKHEGAPVRKKVDFDNQILVVRHEDEGRRQEARKDYMRYLAPTFELAEASKRKPSEPASRLSPLHRNGRWVLEFDALGEAGNATDFRGLLGLEEMFQPLVARLPFERRTRPGARRKLSPGRKRSRRRKRTPFRST